MNIIIEMCHFLSIRYVGKKYPTTIKKKKKKLVLARVGAITNIIR